MGKMKSAVPWFILLGGGALFVALKKWGDDHPDPDPLSGAPGLGRALTRSDRAIIALNQAIEAASYQAFYCREAGNEAVARQLEAFARELSSIDDRGFVPTDADIPALQAWTAWLNGAIAEAKERCRVRPVVVGSRQVVVGFVRPFAPRRRLRWRGVA